MGLMLNLIFVTHKMYTSFTQILFRMCYAEGTINILQCQSKRKAYVKVVNLIKPKKYHSLQTTAHGWYYIYIIYLLAIAYTRGYPPLILKKKNHKNESKKTFRFQPGFFKTKLI